MHFIFFNIYKHDFKQLAKVEKHPRTRIRFIGLSHIQNSNLYSTTLVATRKNRVLHFCQTLLSIICLMPNPKT
jgi:hypothetical protein